MRGGRAGGLTSALSLSLSLSLAPRLVLTDEQTQGVGGKQTVRSAEEMRRERRTMTSVTRALPRLLSDTGQKKSALERKDVRRISFQRPKGTMEYVVSSRCCCLSHPGGCVYIMHRRVFACLTKDECVYTPPPHVCNYVGDGNVSGLIHSCCVAVIMCCRSEFNCCCCW